MGGSKSNCGDCEVAVVVDMKAGEQDKVDKVAEEASDVEQGCTSKRIPSACPYFLISLFPSNAVDATCGTQCVACFREETCLIGGMMVGTGSMASSW